MVEHPQFKQELKLLNKFMKKLILFRHGETKKNKSSKERRLTKRGVEMTRNSTEKLNKYITDCKSICILHSYTIRAEMTSKVIAEILNCSFKIEIEAEDLRILNGDSIRNLVNKNEKQGLRPAKTYLGLSKYLKIESPIELSKRWEKIINKYAKYDAVIIVSHEGSLEAFVTVQY